MVLLTIIIITLFLLLSIKLLIYNFLDIHIQLAYLQCTFTPHDNYRPTLSFATSPLLSSLSYLSLSCRGERRSCAPAVSLSRCLAVKPEGLSAPFAFFDPFHAFFCDQGGLASSLA